MCFKGQNWLKATRECLMWELLPLLTPLTTCEQIKSRAIESHPKCYIESGFCDIFYENFFAILRFINIFDMLTNYPLTQVAQVLWTCVQNNTLIY